MGAGMCQEARRARRHRQRGRAQVPETLETYRGAEKAQLRALVHPEHLPGAAHVLKAREGRRPALRRAYGIFPDNGCRPGGGDAQDSTEGRRVRDWASERHARRFRLQRPERVCERAPHRISAHGCHACRRACGPFGDGHHACVRQGGGREATWLLARA